MPRLPYIKLQFPLKNCMGERVFIHSPFLLTTNTPNHIQGLHGHSKTSPRSRFSAICKLGAFWLAQRNLISRKVLMGAILSLERISLGPENEPGTDGLSAPLEKFSLSANRGHGWEGPSHLLSREHWGPDPLSSLSVGSLTLFISWRWFSFSERYMLYFTRDLVTIGKKKEIAIYPHLFSTSVHFTVVLTSFIPLLGVCSPGPHHTVRQPHMSLGFALSSLWSKLRTQAQHRGQGLEWK